MTNLGRVLILPKGEYNSEVTYYMLDLVLHNGTSWLCKKSVKGIEPSEANKDYWQILIDVNDAVDLRIDNRIESFFGSGDSLLPLTLPSLSLYNTDKPEARGTLDVNSEGALLFGGNTIFHTHNFENLLSEYLNSYLNTYLESNLEKYTKAISSLAKIKTGTYVGNGEQFLNLTFDFAPQMLIAKETVTAQYAKNMLYLATKGVDIVKAINGHIWESSFEPCYVTSIWQENIVTLVGNTYNDINKSGVEYTYFAIG